MQKVLTSSPSFNSGRLLLPPESDRSRLELEIVRNKSGVRVYLNILFLLAPPCPENPERTAVDILFEGKSRVIYPYLLQGSQRLLVEQEEADLLIQTLLDGHSFTIKLGRHEVRIIPDLFASLYKDLMEIPVEYTNTK